MPRFSYMIQDKAGSTNTGTLDADSEAAAIERLQQQGYFILSIQADAPARGFKGFFQRGSVGGYTMVFFSEQLATLLKGGVPLVRALTMLADNCLDPVLKKCLERVVKDVSSGASLHNAFEKHPEVFDTFWVSLVRAGEMAGQLPKVLSQIAEHLATKEEMKAKVATALAYPAVLFFMATGVLVFFIAKIVPTFAEIFRSFGLELPAATKAVIFVSDVLVHNSWVLIAFVAGAVFVLKGYLATEAGQRAKFRFLFGLPFFGEFLKNIETEKFVSTMATMTSSGASILNSLTVVEFIFSRNVRYAKMVKAAKFHVAGGKSISSGLEAAGELPPMVSQMVRMGEESGALVEMFRTLQNFYKQQIDLFIRRFSAVIDPIMVVIIGGMVAFVVIVIFLPIFQLSQLGGG